MNPGYHFEYSGRVLGIFPVRITLDYSPTPVLPVWREFNIPGAHDGYLALSLSIAGREIVAGSLHIV